MRQPTRLASHYLRGLLVISLAFVLSDGVRAEGPVYTCNPPVKPTSLTTREQVNAYAKHESRFHACVMAYAKEQKRLAERQAEAANAAAQTWTRFSSGVPVPACLAPATPTGLGDQKEREVHLRAVERFQSCISAFVDKRRRAAKAHDDAANAAVQNWNNYIADMNSQPTS